jgi:diguanylate cyclase (GGDEF)-like protein
MRLSTGEVSRPTRLLLVENDEWDRLAIRSLIDRGTVSAVVHEVSTLDAARAALAADPFDLVLVDFKLPDGEGAELVAGSHAPVVVLTGLKDTRHCARALRAGAHDFLPKAGLTTARLDHAIREALATAPALLGHKPDESHDALTGLLNRHGLASALEREQDLCRRNARPLSALIVRCDELELISPEPDSRPSELQRVARRVRLAARSSTPVARVSERELIVLLPMTPVERAEQLAGDIRQDIAEELGTPGAVSVAAIEVDSEVSTVAGLIWAAASVRGAKTKDAPAIGSGESGPETGPDRVLFAADKVHSRVLPIMDLGSRKPVAWALRARGPEGDLANPRDMIRAAAAGGHLVEVDLAFIHAHMVRQRKLPPGPIHLCVEAETVREHAQRLVELLSRVQRTVFVCLDATLTDPEALADGVAKLRNVGLLIGLRRVGFGLTPLDGLAVLQPDVVHLDPRVLEAAARPTDGSDAGSTAWPERLLDLIRGTGAEPIATRLAGETDRRVAARLGIGLGYGKIWEDAAETDDPVDETDRPD